MGLASGCPGVGSGFHSCLTVSLGSFLFLFSFSSYLLFSFLFFSFQALCCHSSSSRCSETWATGSCIFFLSIAWAWSVSGIFGFYLDISWTRRLTLQNDGIGWCCTDLLTGSKGDGKSGHGRHTHILRENRRRERGITTAIGVGIAGYTAK